jgi:hypothetical protein
MAACGRSDDNAVRQLLFKMVNDGELFRTAPGRFSLSGKKASNAVTEPLSPDTASENSRVTGLPGFIDSNEKAPLTSAQQLAVERGFVAQQPSSRSEPSTVASVPFMMTREMKERLAELGYNQEQIRNMTPQDGWAAIDKATREWAEVNLR